MLRALPYAFPLGFVQRLSAGALPANALEFARVAPFLVLLALGICQLAWQSIVPDLIYGASCPAGAAFIDEPA